MATIYFRKDTNTYYVNYIVNGQRFREKIGSNKHLAEIRCKEIEVQKERNTLNIVQEITIDKYIEEFLKHAKETKAFKTYQGFYKNKIRLFSGYVKGKISRTKLSQITSKDIEDYKMARLQHAQPTTVHGDLRAIKTFFNRAIDWGYLQKNPCKNVDPIRNIKKNPPHFMSKEEIEKILFTAEGHYLRPFIATAIYAGLRRGELLDLEWEDIDFERMIITLKNKDTTHLKNYRSRAVPLNTKLKAILLPYRQNKGLCFGLPNTSHIQHKIRMAFIGLCKKAGIATYTLHQLRHTFASQLVSAGVSIFKVSQWLGHSDVKTTMIYSHLSSQDDDINRI